MLGKTALYYKFVWRTDQWRYYRLHATDRSTSRHSHSGKWSMQRELLLPASESVMWLWRCHVTGPGRRLYCWNHRPRIVELVTPSGKKKALRASYFVAFQNHTIQNSILSLGAFANLRKATITFVMSVCLPVRPSVCLYVRMEQLGSHWTDFLEIWCLRASRNLSRKFKFD
jgi:hypothetical protein